MPCGIMDQAASALGKEGMAMVIDTKTLDVEYQKLPEGVAVVVCETGSGTTSAIPGIPIGDGRARRRPDS